MGNFTEMAFIPANGIRNKTVFKTVPETEDEARGQIQGLLDQLAERINGLIAELQNIEGICGAQRIGSACIEDLVTEGGVPATTVYSQLCALYEKLDSFIREGVTVADVIDDGDIAENMISEGAVTENKIGLGAVTSEKIGDGEVTQAKLGTIQQMTLDTGDILIYEKEYNRLKLKIAGCVADGVQLAPVVYGVNATPPGGSYPAGTIYIQYVE